MVMNMYSRSARDIRDDYEDMSEEEYEIYRYNIPPRYDGSRFRGRGRGRNAAGRNAAGGAGGDSPSRGNGYGRQDNRMQEKDLPEQEDCDVINGVIEQERRCPEENCILQEFSESAESRIPSEECAVEKECCPASSVDFCPDHGGCADEGNETHCVGGRGGILGGLKLGGEELLILALIFILSGEDGCGDDVILLLALLLLAGG